MSNLWIIDNNKLVSAVKSCLDQESRLHSWIEEDVSILGMDILLIGSEVTTAYNGRIDLLGIDQEGDLYILELKKDLTPREVTAQIIDYASWINGLSPKEVYEIADVYIKNKYEMSFADKFIERFGVSLPEDINNNHNMVIIAGSMDETSNRIVKYLAEVHKLRINTGFFNCFKNNGQEFMVADWLLDQEEVIERSNAVTRPPWTGFYYVNIGHDESERVWDDCVAYGFIAAGYGRKYSKALEKLAEGNPIFAYHKGRGYVGYGLVERSSVISKEFLYEDKKLIDMKDKLKQSALFHDADDEELSDYLVGIRWIKTFPLEQSKSFGGIFANQNIVCKLRYQTTLDFLKKEFGLK